MFQVGWLLILMQPFEVFSVFLGGVDQDAQGRPILLLSQGGTGTGKSLQQKMIRMRLAERPEEIPPMPAPKCSRWVDLLIDELVEVDATYQLDIGKLIAQRMTLDGNKPEKSENQIQRFYKQACGLLDSKDKKKQLVSDAKTFASTEGMGKLFRPFYVKARETGCVRERETLGQETAPGCDGLLVANFENAIKAGDCIVYETTGSRKDRVTTHMDRVKGRGYEVVLAVSLRDTALLIPAIKARGFVNVVKFIEGVCAKSGRESRIESIVSGVPSLEMKNIHAPRIPGRISGDMFAKTLDVQHQLLDDMKTHTGPDDPTQYFAMFVEHNIFTTPKAMTLLGNPKAGEIRKLDECYYKMDQFRPPVEPPAPAKKAQKPGKIGDAQLGDAQLKQILDHIARNQPTQKKEPAAVSS